ncbi:hypothetical protein BH23ACT6_BH23ACT6_11740 [soil metagenome]
MPSAATKAPRSSAISDTSISLMLEVFVGLWVSFWLDVSVGLWASRSVPKGPLMPVRGEVAPASVCPGSHLVIAHVHG